MTGGGGGKPVSIVSAMLSSHDTFGICVCVCSHEKYDFRDKMRVSTLGSCGLDLNAL